MLTDKIGRDDPRYADLSVRGFNKRFSATPDHIQLVTSTAEVITAVQEAVQKKVRLVVRSGGHCLEGFVADPAVQLVIDTSLMTGIYYDENMSAIAVEAGATVGDMQRRVFLQWGLTIPLGEHPDIGAGGHILGGAFGYLCRQHGLSSDYLHAVEVVMVNASGTAYSVVATNAPNDPHYDLWWAHTGGGGGNFGIVTRYWLRNLPKAPSSIHVYSVTWHWADLNEAAFTKLTQQFCTWCEQHAAPDSPYTRLYSRLILNRQQAGKIILNGVSTAGHLFDEHLAEISKGLEAPYERTAKETTWLRFILNPFPEFYNPGAEARFKLKDGFLRKSLTPEQIKTAWHYLTTTDHNVAGGNLGLDAYGGKVNTIAADATATAQRNAVITMACIAGWEDPKEEEAAVAWVREFYHALFAATGGVPADGAKINHPDPDLADPAWNTSGIPWYTLYYEDNYPRLQRVKAAYDPLNVFYHALSIRG